MWDEGEAIAGQALAGIALGSAVDQAVDTLALRGEGEEGGRGDLELRSGTLRNAGSLVASRALEAKASQALDNQGGSLKGATVRVDVGRREHAAAPVPPGAGEAVHRQVREVAQRAVVGVQRGQRGDALQADESPLQKRRRSRGGTVDQAWTAHRFSNRVSSHFAVASARPAFQRPSAKRALRQWSLEGGPRRSHGEMAAHSVGRPMNRPRLINRTSATPSTLLQRAFAEQPQVVPLRARVLGDLQEVPADQQRLVADPFAQAPVGAVPLQGALGAPNQVWSMDFVFDALSTGRRIKCLTVVDDFTKESVGILVEHGISGFRVLPVPAKARTRIFDAFDWMIGDCS